MSPHFLPSAAAVRRTVARRPPPPPPTPAHPPTRPPTPPVFPSPALIQPPPRPSPRQPSLRAGPPARARASCRRGPSVSVCRSTVIYRPAAERRTPWGAQPRGPGTRRRAAGDEGLAGGGAGRGFRVFSDSGTGDRWGGVSEGRGGEGGGHKGGGWLAKRGRPRRSPGRRPRGKHAPPHGARGGRSRPSAPSARPGGPLCARRPSLSRRRVQRGPRRAPRRAPAACKDRWRPGPTASGAAARLGEATLHSTPLGLHGATAAAATAAAACLRP